MEAAAITPTEAQSLPLTPASRRHHTFSRVPTMSVVAGVAHGGHDPDRGPTMCMWRASLRHRIPWLAEASRRGDHT